jgi:hypothetical protein
MGLGYVYRVVIAGRQEAKLEKETGLGHFRRRRLSGFQPLYVLDEAGLLGGLYAADELRNGLVLRARLQTAVRNPIEGR